VYAISASYFICFQVATRRCLSDVRRFGHACWFFSSHPCHSCYCNQWWFYHYGTIAHFNRLPSISLIPHKSVYPFCHFNHIKDPGMSLSSLSYMFNHFLLRLVMYILSLQNLYIHNVVLTGWLWCRCHCKSRVRSTRWVLQWRKHARSAEDTPFFVITFLLSPSLVSVGVPRERHVRADERWGGRKCGFL